VQLEKELFNMFAKFGKLDSVVVKRSFNNKYCFAFVEYHEGEDASQAVVE
jgi:RNA recognition motif-containing protein